MGYVETRDNTGCWKIEDVEKGIKLYMHAHAAEVWYALETPEFTAPIELHDSYQPSAENPSIGTIVWRISRVGLWNRDISSQKPVIIEILSDMLSNYQRDPNNRRRLQITSTKANLENTKWGHQSEVLPKHSSTWLGHTYVQNTSTKLIRKLTIIALFTLVTLAHIQVNKFANLSLTYSLVLYSVTVLLPFGYIFYRWYRGRK